MKKHLRAIPLHMLLLAGIIPALPVAAAPASLCDAGAAASPPAKNAPAATTAVVPSEKTAFLGIHTERVDAATRRRLNLADDTGLRVHLVAPNSPAHGKLLPGDVLTLLNAQILCNREQFATLVRVCKPGDVVTLKIYRDGEASEVRVTLGSTDSARANSLVPELRFRINGRDVPLGDFLHDKIARLNGGVITVDPDALSGIPEEIREHIRELQDETRRRMDETRRRMDETRRRMDETRSRIEKWRDQRRQKQPADALKGQKLEGKIAPGGHKKDEKPVNPKHGKIEITPENPLSGVNVSRTFSDNETETYVTDRDGTACLSMRNGLCCLKIQDTTGKVIFDGPVDTPAHRAALPKNIAKKLETIEQIIQKGVVVSSAPPVPAEPSKK
ncbi:MAG: PDZ domain-containing protein [Puniceicoccales bacterium]|nr:PDZ domain-containing protein [Puniceicoccales bacterium]